MLISIFGLTLRSLLKKLTMKLTATRTLYFLFFLFFSVGLKAQLNADFYISNGQGCAPLKVAFTNTSSGTSANTTYTWSFGNGNTSVLTNPSAIYYAEGNFTVTLTIKEGTQTSVKTKQVNVYKKPTADFNWSASKGCSAFTVNFNSTSTAGDGYLSSYYWDFGDGSTQQSYGSSVSHTYQSIQKASVTLTATNQYGCYSTVTKNDIIETIDPLVADFTVDQTVLCKISEQVAFTNKSSGPGTLSYLWDFGDGGTSTEVNPKHVFNQKGIYTIKLTVTSSEGCVTTKTLSNYVNVASYKADFSMSASEVCSGQPLQITIQSSPAPSQTTWQMGDGNTNYYTYNFSYYYYNKGDYNIKLVNSFGSCKDSVIKTVKVKQTPIVNGFLDTLLDKCGAPAKIQFRDTTANAVKWEWSFMYDYYNPVVNSTLQNPVFTFPNSITYNTQLKVTNTEGCSAVASKYVTVTRPYVSIGYLSSTANGTSSCTPFTVKFNAGSTEPIANYKWTFPGGVTSTDPTPEFTFSTVGRHTVTLLYTTVNGCTGTVSYDNINILAKTVADFISTSGTEICGNTPVLFKSTSANQLYPGIWIIDGNYVQGNFTYNNFDLNYKFMTSGKHTITLIATNGTCSDTITKTDYINVKPPFVNIADKKQDCSNRGEVTFTDGSTQVKSCHWDFGDNSSADYTSAQPTIKHQYTSSGYYKVKLSATNDACTVSDSVNVTVLLKQNPQLSSASTNLCAAENLNYTITGLEKIPGINLWNYNFYRIEYGDNSQFSGYNNTSYPYYIDRIPFSGSLSGGLNPSKDKLRMIVYNSSNGCYDTTNYLSYSIKGAVAAFSIVADKLCYQSPVQFMDNSTVTGNNKILSWEWNFGDGITQTFTQGGAVSHNYTNPGGYYVTLKITDAGGCSSSTTSYSKYVTVNGPKAAFYSSGNNVALNTTVYFYNNTNDYNSYNTQYKWDYGDGSSSTAYYPSHTYTAAGTYTVTLTATDPQTGCTSSDTQTITVKDFNTAFSFSTSYISNVSCPPVVARFNNTSVGYVKINWDFGDGTTAGNVNYPSHIYTKPGKYFVKLFVYGENGLKGTYIDSVIVKNIQASLEFNPAYACASQQIDFKATAATGTSSYMWDYGDGVLQSSTDSTAFHFYKYPGVYKPVILLTNADGCSVPVSSPGNIVIDSLSVGIKGIPSQLCNQATINFMSDVYSVGASQSPDFLSYKWNFGTGNAADTSNEMNPSFMFNKPGTYIVTLSVHAKSGCYKEVTETLVVKQSSKGTITGPLDLCPGQSAQFTGTASITNGVQWKWDFKNGQTSTIQNPSSQLYNSAGNYLVTLVVNNQGCTDTTTHLLTVHPDPVVQVNPASATLCAGKTVQLNASGGTSYQWTPVTGLNNALAASPVASPASSTNYTVKVTTDFGCTKSSSIQVDVVKPFKLSATTAYAICEGETVNISATGASTYKWINNTLGLSNTNTSTVTANPASTTLYTVVGYDSYGCFTDTSFINVTVNSKPTVNAGPDIESLPGKAVPLNATGSNDISKWIWTPSDYLSCTQCQSPISTAIKTTTYILKVLTAQNCSTTDTVTVKILCNGSQIYVPSAFTPNNDGKNDVFGIMGNGASLIKHFVIYDRWGNKVFEKKNIKADDPAAGWDGTYRNFQSEPGAYSYYAELVCDATGEIFVRNGTVILIR